MSQVQVNLVVPMQVEDSEEGPGGEPLRWCHVSAATRHELACYSRIRVGKHKVSVFLLWRGMQWGVVTGCWRSWGWGDRTHRLQPHPCGQAQGPAGRLAVGMPPTRAECAVAW